MSARKGLEQWHRTMKSGNRPEDLEKIIHEGAVFHSPVVHSPQRGRDLVVKYLPEFKGKRVDQSSARPMTIRHVLSHTAGFWFFLFSSLV